jgi:antitoxin FitA
VAQLLVRNLDDEVKKRLQRRAARHGRSMEEEVREILRAAVDRDEPGPSAPGLGTRIAERFAGLGLADELPELCGAVAVPAVFGTE